MRQTSHMLDAVMDFRFGDKRSLVQDKNGKDCKLKYSVGPGTSRT